MMGQSQQLILMAKAVMLGTASFVSLGIGLGWATPALADEDVQDSEELHLDEAESPATTVAEWLAQMEAAIVEITGVRVENTETGLQVILETADGDLSVPAPETVGNALVAEIPNAVLALPEGDEFQATNPAEGIARVSVTAVGDERIQVAITGTNAPPEATVSAEAGNLVLSVVPGIAQVGDADDAIQIVVTGEQDEGYNPSRATTATRTDTPLRDIPQSIQVIPRQLIEDRQVEQLTDILRTATNVTAAFSARDVAQGFTIRGFEIFAEGEFLLNGVPIPTVGVLGTANVERVEILRGPASVLFGQLPPGGTVNIITKQPLEDPFYRINGSIGNFDSYSGSLDFSGPLNSDESLLYRLNLSVRDSGSFVNSVEEFDYLIAPVVTWRINDRTNLTVEGEYSENQNTLDPGLPAVGTILNNPVGELPSSTFLGDPNSFFDFRGWRVSYILEHQFNENWQFDHTLQFAGFNRKSDITFPINLLDDNRTLMRRGSRTTGFNRGFDIAANANLVGNFETGSIQHQLLTGVEFSRENFKLSPGGNEFFSVSPIDIFDPVQPPSFVVDGSFDQFENTVQKFGVYLQDQIYLSENLILLLGGRFDIINFRRSGDSVVNTSQQNESFSPRAGILYRPLDNISLYASYSSSFQQEIGLSIDDEPFEPTRGNQFEIGVKADINDRLSANLAFFDLTRTNVVTADPDNPDFSIQTGEQNSRGIEFELAGEILPGWDLTLGYAYTDARVTQDNDIPEGNQLPNAPRNNFNLWTKYEIQDGNYQGLGFGLGLFYVGEREGDLDNTIQLPSYLRTDAALFYRRDNFNIQLNIENLFGIRYFETARNRLRIFPGAPLTVRGEVSWTF